MTNKLTVEQDDLNWLIAQLEAWPERTHPGRTTNVEFLMKTAAHTLRHRQQAEARAAGLIAAARALAISAGKLNVALDRLEKFRRHKEALVRDMTIFADALTAYRSASTMRDTK